MPKLTLHNVSQFLTMPITSLCSSQLTYPDKAPLPWRDPGSTPHPDTAPEPESEGLRLKGKGCGGKRHGGVRVETKILSSHHGWLWKDIRNTALCI